MVPAGLESLIASWGCPAVALGALLEGEAALLLAAAAARAGWLSIWGVGLFALAGGLLGDWLLYALGRAGGAAWLARRPAWQRRSARARAFLRRRAGTVVLLSRFAYGLRTVLPLCCGVAGVPWPLYLGLSLCSGVLWAGTYAALGWLAAGLLQRLPGGPAVLALATLAGLVLLLAGSRLLYRRSGAKKTA